MKDNQHKDEKETLMWMVGSGEVKSVIEIKRRVKSAVRAATSLLSRTLYSYCALRLQWTSIPDVLRTRVHEGLTLRIGSAFSA